MNPLHRLQRPARPLAAALALACTALHLTVAGADPAPQAGPAAPLARSVVARGPVTAGPTASPGAMLACVILPVRSADLGTPVAGVVSSIEVERGDTVRKGQLLARLRSEVEVASTRAARGRADSDAEVRGALAAEDLARQKVERSRALLAENFISGQAMQQAEAELRVAGERVALARDQRGIAVLEADGAAAQLSLRTLRAPFDGVITERHANPGERVEDKPVLRIVDISRLRVDLVAPSALYGRLRVGQALSVQPELVGAAARVAQVVQVDRVLDPASNSFRLRLEMDNPGEELPAGLRCKAELEPPLAAAPAPTHRPGG